MITEERLKFLLQAEREALLSEFRSILDSRPDRESRKLSAKEAAGYLGISLSCLYKNVAFIPHRKFGKKLVFIANELDDFDFPSITERRHGPQAYMEKGKLAKDGGS